MVEGLPRNTLHVMRGGGHSGESGGRQSGEKNNPNMRVGKANADEKPSENTPTLTSEATPRRGEMAEGGCDAKQAAGCVQGKTRSSARQGMLVARAAGVHPAPSRTRQLSPQAPMVLHWRRCGRVGRCQREFFPTSARQDRQSSTYPASQASGNNLPDASNTQSPPERGDPWPTRVVFSTATPQAVAFFVSTPL